jgi:hypothetical protein
MQAKANPPSCSKDAGAEPGRVKPRTHCGLQDGSRNAEASEAFWQTEFLQKVLFALVIMMTVGAAARLLIEFAQSVSF